MYFRVEIEPSVHLDVRVGRSLVAGEGDKLLEL